MKKLSLIKKVGILGLATLIQQTSYSGWLSNIGQRIVNGAVNTVQNNISRKVNKTVDDALDGKLGNTTGNKTKSNKNHNQSAAYVESKTAEVKNVQKDSIVESTAEQEKETKAVATSTEPVSRITARGKALRFSNDYKEFDLGNGYQLNGELIYIKSLEMGQEYMKVEELLDPGLYVLYVLGTSYAENVRTIKNNQCVLGCGIKPIKAKFANKDGHLSAKDELGDAYLVEVLQNTQGRLEIIMANSENLRGTGRIELYKVPEGPKWLR